MRIHRRCRKFYRRCAIPVDFREGNSSGTLHVGEDEHPVSSWDYCLRELIIPAGSHFSFLLAMTELIASGCTSSQNIAYFGLSFRSPRVVHGVTRRVVHRRRLLLVEQYTSLHTAQTTADLSAPYANDCVTKQCRCRLNGLLRLAIHLLIQEDGN
jgi:hypothetical protein